MIPILLASVLGDLCTPPPAGPVDPDDSRAYTQVGDEARQAGDVRVAAKAYRRALASDPSNQAAKAALDELCRTDGTTPALAAAIAAYQRGELAAARAQLRAIVTANGPDADAAKLYLELVALRTSDGVAEPDLEGAARDPRYAAIASELHRLTRRGSGVVVGLLVAGEVDTNARLLPDAPADGTAPPSVDQDLAIAVGLVARPRPWMTLRDQIAFRALREASDLNFAAETGSVAVETRRGGTRLGAGYDLDLDLLAGDFYLAAHRLSATARVGTGPVALDGTYAVRRRDFGRSSDDGFDGWTHLLELGAIAHPGPRVELAAYAIAWRDALEDDTFSDVVGGGRIAVSLQLSPRVRVLAAAAAWYARFDGAEPDGSLRRDRHAEATVDVEVDLGNHVTAIGGATGMVNGSTLDDFDYTRAVMRVGLAVALGGGR